MLREAARTPGGAVRTFVVAVASGLLVIALALEVAVATFSEGPAPGPGFVNVSCADTHAPAQVGEGCRP